MGEKMSIHPTVKSMVEENVGPEMIILNSHRSASGMRSHVGVRLSLRYAAEICLFVPLAI